MTGTSLINLGDLAKPAVVLIEKVSEAIGAVFRPTQIRRVARAEADAERIRVLAGLETTELEARGLARLAFQEGRKQANIEAITAGAVHRLDESAQPERMDIDWLTHFFDRCALISNTEMQSLWSRLLAGEATDPGSFSKRTVDAVASLEKTDAALFTALCAFCVTADEKIPAIFDYEKGIYGDHGVSFSGLNHLSSIGLISFSPVSGYVIDKLGQETDVDYFDQKYHLRFAGAKDNELKLGSVLLTRTGQELAPISGATPIPGFAEYAVSFWTKRSVAVYSRLSLPDREQDVAEA